MLMPLAAMTAPAGYVYPLSLITSVGGAFSVRRLSATYNGPCMFVQRTSDNATTNIGFNSEGGLDTDALLSFVGSASGLVAVWYDQSGLGRDIRNNTPAQRPFIVVNGNLQGMPDNPYPAITGFGGNVRSLSATTTFAINTTAHMAVALQTSGSDKLLFSNTAGTYVWRAQISGIANRVELFSGVTSQTTIPLPIFSTTAASARFSTSTSRVSFNGVSANMTSPGTTQLGAFSIGRTGLTAMSFYQEWIFTNAATSNAVIDSVIANQKSYYGIVY